MIFPVICHGLKCVSCCGSAIIVGTLITHLKENKPARTVPAGSLWVRNENRPCPSVHFPSAELSDLATADSKAAWGKGSSGVSRRKHD